MQAALPSIPQATRIRTGLGFVLGCRMAVAAKILIKSRRGDVLQERERLPGAARMGKPGILPETAAEEATSLLYSSVYLHYRAKCFSSPFEICKWVSHSFRAVYWLKLALVQKGHPAGHCPLYTGVCIARE